MLFRLTLSTWEVLEYERFGDIRLIGIPVLVSSSHIWCVVMLRHDICDIMKNDVITFFVMTYEVIVYEVKTYNVMTYEVMTYDVRTYDVMTYDVMIYL